MIYTLTLNPALDLELHIEKFEFNAVSRANRSQMDCGGKGFNVSRLLKNLNVESVAMGFVGGKNGERLHDELSALNIETDFTPIEGETRLNVSVVADEDANHIKVNQAGPQISERELACLLQQIDHRLAPNDWWVLGGSLPLGVPTSIYATLIERIKAAGAFVILDTSGEALRLGCVAKPTLIKPNLEEALELAERGAHEPAELDSWLGDVLAKGPEHLVMSLGKDGALYTDGRFSVVIESPEIIERNPIGAGDSLVAGMVAQLSKGQDYATALKFGVACGAATASQPGTTLGSKTDIETLLATMD